MSVRPFPFAPAISPRENGGLCRRLGRVTFDGQESTVLRIRPFQSEDGPAVINLWQRCGLVRPHNDPKKDIMRKSKVRPDLFLVGLIGHKLIASVMAGYEGHRGWIHYLAVSPDQQRKGFGRTMMEEAERLLRAEGCPKINLLVRTSNLDVLAFYEATGYVQDDVVSLGKRLEHDHKSA